MYRNRDRLGASLATLVAQYGPDVLRDPQRTRNLLIDEYGADQGHERTDVDQLVRVLQTGYDTVTQPDAPLSSASAAAAASTGLTLDDAAWTITTLRSLTARIPAAAGPRPTRPSVVGQTVLHDGLVPVERVEEQRAGWPAAAKVVVAVLAVLAVAAIATGAVLAVRGRRDADRLRDRQAEMEAQQRDSKKTAGDSSKTLTQRVDDLTAAVADAEARATKAQQELDEAKQQSTTDAATIQDLTAKVDAANASVTGLQQQVDAAVQTAATFSVGFGGVSLPQVQFRFNGDTTVCDGFKPEVTCSNYRSFSGYLRQDGADKFFEIPNVARVPLTTTDGLSYTGQVGTPGTGIKCEGVAADTIVSVGIQPVSFSADPSTRQIMATAYNASVDLFSPGGGCTDAHQAFAGVLTFDGLS